MIGNKKPSEVYLTVDKRSVDGGIQVSIGDGHIFGYRLAGPKYDGSGKRLLTKKLTPRDKTEILSWLRKVR